MMAPVPSPSPGLKGEPKPQFPQLAVAPRPMIIAKNKKSPPALSPLSTQASSPRNSITGKSTVVAQRAQTPIKSNYQLEDAQVSQLSTSKVWVLPPRPKPGRKPSTDTPPTKRKAQNRAAQRAFRERRAARVSELEEMLTEVNAERDVREQKLNETLKAMSQENYELRSSLEELRREIRSLSSSRMPSFPATEIGTPRAMDSAPSPFSGSSPAQIHHHSISGPSSVNSNQYPPSMNQMASPAPSMESPMDLLDRVLELRLPVPEPKLSDNDTTKKDNEYEEEEDCGVCTKEDCICESLGIREPSKNRKASQSSTISATPEASSSVVPLKRRRKSVSRNLNPFKKLKKSNTEDMEMDFTKEFSKPAPAKQKEAPQLQIDTVSHMSNPATPVDRCGFCSDGTPCLCAETAAQEASNMAELQDNTLPPLVLASSSHPSTPLSTSRSNSLHNINGTLNSVKLPSLQSAEYRSLASPISGTPTEQQATSSGSRSGGGCTGNPGTCSQCQADPMSTLFCTTLANRVSAAGVTKSSRHGSVTETDSAKKSAQEGCCGGSKSGGGSCCKDKKQAGSGPSTPTTATAPPAPSTPTPGMFIPCSAAYQTLSRHKDFGRVDLGTLVGKLHTRGMQVEVSSVANVLRELDRRLYQ